MEARSVSRETGGKSNDPATAEHDDGVQRWPDLTLPVIGSKILPGAQNTFIRERSRTRQTAVFLCLSYAPVVPGAWLIKHPSGEYARGLATVLSPRPLWANSTEM